MSFLINPYRYATGGGGGGGMSLPSTDLVFQYDFSALGLSDNAEISTVEDLVGSNDLSQGTSTNRPLFKTGIMANGKSVARFDGVDNFLVGTSTATYKHLFIVLKCTGAGSVFPTYDGIFSGTLNSGGYTYVGNSGGGGFFDTDPTSTFVKSGTTTTNAPFSAFELCEASRATDYSFTPSVGKDREFTTRYFTGDIAGIFAYSSIQSGTPLTDIRAEVLAYYGV